MESVRERQGARILSSEGLICFVVGSGTLCMGVGTVVERELKSVSDVHELYSIFEVDCCDSFLSLSLLIIKMFIFAEKSLSTLFEKRLPSSD
jgi:hypothetical protein